MSMMTDFEQAVVDHHQHSIPNNLLDCPAPPILQESGACITPKNEEEKEKVRMEEEDLINRCNNIFNIPLPSRFDHVYPPEPATASPGTMAPVVDTTMNNKNSTMTVKLEQQKIDSLLLKLRETKAKRRELEKKTESLMEQISFHQSEGRKLENWHACRMVAWKAITNGKMHLAKSTTLENDECTQSEMMDLKATVTDNRSNFSTWKIEEEALKCYLKQESEYSIIRRDLIDEFSRSCDNEDFAKYDDLIQLSPSLPQRVRTKELIAAQIACETERVAEEAMYKECNILETKLKVIEEDARVMETTDFFVALRRFENTSNNSHWKRCCARSMLETMRSLSKKRKELARIHLANLCLKLDVNKLMENSVNLLGGEES